MHGEIFQLHLPRLYSLIISLIFLLENWHFSILIVLHYELEDQTPFFAIIQASALSAISLILEFGLFC